MESKLTPKELEFYMRFLKVVGEVQKNQNQSVGIYVEKHAKEIPQKIALYFEDKQWTWEEINEESNRYANYFLSNGLIPGDTIALMIENCPEFLFATTGINKVQGISALINFNQKRQALIHAFNVVESKWIIVSGKNLPSFMEIVDQLSLESDHILVIKNYKNTPHNFIDLADCFKTKLVLTKNPNTTRNSKLNEMCSYIFSSGTTGLPKAIIMWNVRFINQTLSTSIETSRLSSNDVIYITVPLYHNLGFGISWTASWFTGAAVALREQFSASNFWKDIHKYGATFTTYVGEIPRYLLNQPVSKYDKNHKLKNMSGVGLQKSIWEKFKSRFEIEHIWEFYGLTEGAAGFLNIEEKPGMIGRMVLPGTELAKVDPETGEFFKNENSFCIKCEVGDTGMALNELQPDTQFTGYKDKKKTEKKIMYNVFRKGDKFFNTGDMLKLHEDKWLSFADRFGDTFRWKGENVSTMEVESIINSHPLIETSAVYGVSIPETEGKAGMAALKINPNSNFDIEQFSTFILDNLPNYSIPLFIRIRKEFELVGPLKIKKFDLRIEAYDPNRIQDPLYYWDFKSQTYKIFNNEKYKELIKGKIKV
ncbi:MAG: long-chain-acyl-CoA synthetase [Candidatus Thorarchaeota archaeon]